MRLSGNRARDATAASIMASIIRNTYLRGNGPAPEVRKWDRPRGAHAGPEPETAVAMSRYSPERYNWHVQRYICACNTICCTCSIMLQHAACWQWGCGAMAAALSGNAAQWRLCLGGSGGWAKWERPPR